MNLKHAPNILGSLLIAASYGVTIYQMCNLTGSGSTRLAYSDAITIYLVSLLGHVIIVAFRANQLRRYGLMPTPTLPSKIAWRKKYWLPQSSLAYVIIGYGLNDESGRQIHKTMLATAARVVTTKAAIFMTVFAIASLLIVFGKTDLAGAGVLDRLQLGSSCLALGLFSSMILALSNGFVSLALLTVLSRSIENKLERARTE